jgi:hypothetical protein
MWTCADGRDVLFNRYYEPIWERRGAEVKPGNREEHVRDIVQRGWFFDDFSAPWRLFPSRVFPKRVERLEQILTDFRNGLDVSDRFDSVEQESTKKEVA